MNYAVENKYFNNGTVKTKVFKTDTLEKGFSSFKECSKCDVYVDVFGSQKEAHDFVRRCKEA